MAYSKHLCVVIFAFLGLGMCVGCAGGGNESNFLNDPVVQTLANCVDNTDLYTFSFVAGPLTDVLAAVDDQAAFPNITLTATSDPNTFEFEFTVASNDPGVDTLTGEITVPNGDGAAMATWELVALDGVVTGENLDGRPFTLDLVGGEIVSFHGAGRFNGNISGCASTFDITEAQKVMGDLVDPATGGVVRYVANLIVDTLSLTFEFGVGPIEVLLNDQPESFESIFGPG